MAHGKDICSCCGKHTDIVAKLVEDETTNDQKTGISLTDVQDILYANAFFLGIVSINFLSI